MFLVFLVGKVLDRISVVRCHLGYVKPVTVPVKFNAFLIEFRQTKTFIETTNHTYTFLTSRITRVSCYTKNEEDVIWVSIIGWNFFMVPVSLYFCLDFNDIDGVSFYLNILVTTCVCAILLKDFRPSK